ncbi:MAG: endopeptidase La [Oscillospiraceae bacterium]|nr:endopeptidase La [Oscillospiraceae bacterium]
MIVIPVFDFVAVPHSKVYLQSEKYKDLSGSAPVKGDQVIILWSKDDDPTVKLDMDSFKPIGLSGTVHDVDQSGFVVIKTNDRIDLKSIGADESGAMKVGFTWHPDNEDYTQDEEKEVLVNVRSVVSKYVSQFQWGPLMNGYIARWETVGEALSVTSNWFALSSDEAYMLIEEDSRRARVEKMASMIYEGFEMAKLSRESANQFEQDNQKLYRESAIKKQMKYLQKELDEMHPDNVSDVQRFQKKIEESGMNETAMKEALKVLNRMKQEDGNGNEYAMLYDYLDFLTGLSWKAPEPKKIDLDKAAEILDVDHYGLKKVKDRIIQQIAVMDLQEKQSGSILLFVGAPGTGKTSIGQSIAKALDREYVRVSLGGVRDEADIRGHRRTYIGAMPGRIMDGIEKSGVNNPVMVLDEVDKLSASYNGDPASALLEVLDPEQNNTFTDHYMNVPYDLSNVFFICTANSVDTIPEPLLNRMEVIQFSGYTASEKFQIAKQHLIPKAMKATGIKEDQLSITDEAVRKIISDYTMEGGVRGLKKRIDTLCRVSAVNIVRGNLETLTVDTDSLKDYLDMKPIRHGHVLEKKEAGIVTGLAWTAAGGEILFIETLFTKGSGKITITGQLGDVMKESVQIAISLVKSLFPDKADLFTENDLHVHVPEGAVPKDGPSAGITLTTALSSLVTGNAVSPEFAMTGEVSLRGVVTPIGGLPEKLMAAVRAGITKVFIPQDNVEDLKDVPDEVKEKLEIIPVNKVTDVLSKTGII